MSFWIWLDPSPVIVKPALDRFEALPAFLVRFILGRTRRAALALDVARNFLSIQNSFQLVSSRGLHPARSLDPLPSETTQLAMRHIDCIVNRNVVGGREQLFSFGYSCL